MRDAVTLPTKLYKVLIIAAGIFTLAFLTATSPFTGNWWSFVFLCLLAIITETQTILIGKMGFSITIAVIICAMLTCNITETAWISALSVLGTYSRVKGGKSFTIFNIPVSATLFNASSYELGFLAAYAVYRALGGHFFTLGTSFGVAMREINETAFPLIVSIFIFAAANAVIVTCLLSIRFRKNLVEIWAANVPRMVASTFFVGLIGLLITAVYVSYGWFLVLVLFVPFLLARYVFSMYKDLQENYLQTITSFSTAIETKDPYTNGHSRRVEFYSGIIAAEMGLSSQRRQILRYAALLHDIGKIAVDESILHKTEPLTEEEFAVLRRHPANGEHILEGIEFLSRAAKIIRSHHEWYNGKGYPDGLSGKEIPLEAQILTVADCYDAMTSDRPYRRAFTHEKAMAELFACSGSQFAPKIVSAFEKAMKKEGTSPMLFDAAVCGLLVGFLAGGRFSHLLDMPLRHLWLLIGAVLVNLLPRIPFFAALLSPFGTGGAVCFALIRYIPLLGFVAFNWRCIPVDVVGAGGALNMLVTLANGGRMPVVASAVAEGSRQNAENALLKSGEILNYTLTDAHTRLAFLCDRIEIPFYDWLLRRVHYYLSIGDLLIAAGIFGLIVTLMGPMRLANLKKRLKKRKNAC